MTTFKILSGCRDVLAACTAVMALMMAPDAWGQTTTEDWRRGTTLAGFIGAASPSSETSAAAGAALGWELTPHFTIEGRAIWMDAGHRADSFAALLGVRVPLLPARPFVPFVSAGAGVFLATFDSTSSTMPHFYQRRMMSGSTGFQGRTFEDFVASLGGGADVFLARHLALRPEVAVLIVTTTSDTRTVPVLGVQLAYHFESHPITPARR